MKQLDCDWKAQGMSAMVQTEGKGGEPRREKNKETRKGKGDLAGTCRYKQPPELPLQRSGVELRDFFFLTRNKEEK